MLQYGHSDDYQSATTDGDGRFEVRGLYYGVEAITVLKEGHVALRRVLWSDGNTTVDLELPR